MRRSGQIIKKSRRPETLRIRLTCIARYYKIRFEQNYSVAFLSYIFFVDRMFFPIDIVQSYAVDARRAKSDKQATKKKKIKK